MLSAVVMSGYLFGAVGSYLPRPGKYRGRPTARASDGNIPGLTMPGQADATKKVRG